MAAEALKAPNSNETAQRQSGIGEAKRADVRDSENAKLHITCGHFPACSAKFTANRCGLHASPYRIARGRFGLNSGIIFPLFIPFSDAPLLMGMLST